MQVNVRVLVAGESDVTDCLAALLRLESIASWLRPRRKLLGIFRRNDAREELREIDSLELQPLPMTHHLIRGGFFGTAVDFYSSEKPCPDSVVQRAILISLAPPL